MYIYAQQVMALALQEKVIIAEDIPKWIALMPGFASIEPRDLKDVIDYMLSSGILHSDSGILGIGRAGERSFGKKNFEEVTQ